MCKLSLWFSMNEELTLEKSIFTHPSLGTEQKAVRGKTAGAYHGYNTFQWTPAVQSMTMLMLRTAALKEGEPPTPGAALEGENSCPASSLDYSIGKAPSWLYDVFGVDALGTPLAKRLFHRTNPEQKKERAGSGGRQ